MIYYRYLDLNYQDCSTQLLNYIQVYRPDLFTDTKTGDWKRTDLQAVKSKCPALEQLFATLNLTVKFLSFFVSFYPIGGIHIDDSQELRINLPILNCNNTETRFYTTQEPPVKKFLPNGVPYFYIDPDKCQQVDQYILTRPVVFDPIKPHAVFVNNPVLPRISCTIAFYENIQHLLYE